MEDAERWQRAREIFDAVVDLDASTRSRRLDEDCGGDADLRCEVESLLDFDRHSHGTITHIVGGAALDAAAQLTPDDEPMPTAIGRYRVLEQIGEGGMGRVFLAEDTSLGRRVALKVPPAYLSAHPAMRRRLQQEARAAATLNHPHVCVVHEVSETADGRPFIAMEYVEGETLATRLKRGALSVEDVLDVGRQAASALSAAHARGVVHRDLKPSNIMMTAHGIKLLDFGLATVARDTVAAEQTRGAFIGTVPYMSPEQVRSEEVDHRTDLFSLGAVLYEAATGHLPFEAPTARATCEAILEREHRPPSDLVQALSAGFDRVIASALTKDRDNRYQDAREFARDLDRCAAAPGAVPESIDRVAAGSVWRRRVTLAIAAVVAAIAVGMGYRWLNAPATKAIGADRAILLGEVANTTGDPTFDGTLDEALAMMLGQTPFLTIVPETTVREALRQMTRAADAPLTDDLAREVCQRRGFSRWISGSIAPVGNRFAITVAAKDCATGGDMTSQRVEADGKVQVLAALGTAVAQTRAALGESSESIERFATPIETATTSSLDALKAYTLGRQQASSGNYLVALNLFQQAVQIDPEFAIAYQAIARQRINLVYPQESIADAATRAFELRSRATEQERFAIEASYHLSVSGDLERAIEISTRWSTAYPNDWRPHHALGDLYYSVGQFENGVASERETLRLNPDMASAYSNLAGSLFALDRFEEARAVYRQAMNRGLDAPEYHAFLWRIAYYLGDEEQMKRELDWAAASSSWSANMPALAAALQGRWRDALALSAQAREGFERRQMTGSVALSRRYEALTGALLGDCQRERLDAAWRLNVEYSIDDWSRVAVALALCGQGREVIQLTQRQAIERPEDTLLRAVWLPLVRAAAALARSPREVIDALEHTPQPYDGLAESLPLYLRGQAWLRLGKSAEARAAFQQIVDHKGRTLWLPMHPLGQLGLARAAALSGDVAAASRAYEDLFRAWANADADLPVLVAARREYSKLRTNLAAGR